MKPNSQSMIYEMRINAFKPPFPSVDVIFFSRKNNSVNLSKDAEIFTLYLSTFPPLPRNFLPISNERSNSPFLWCAKHPTIKVEIMQSILPRPVSSYSAVRQQPLRHVSMKRIVFLPYQSIFF